MKLQQAADLRELRIKESTSFTSILQKTSQNAVKMTLAAQEIMTEK